MRNTIVALAFILGCIACGSAKADETKLIMTTISLPDTPASAMLREWADKVNAAGQGVVHLDIRDGFSLVNSSNWYDRLQSDVVQVTFGSANYVAGTFRLSQVIVLPFLFESAGESSAVYWRLYKSGLLDQEFDKVTGDEFYINATLVRVVRPGRIGLHSLPDSESWYRDVAKFTDVEFDAQKNMRYFEMTEAQVTAFLAEEK